MKKTLVIGSTVIDVLLKLPVLPGRGDDINIISSEYRVGGCAYNVFKALKLFKSPAMLCSPVGTGVYGRLVRECLESEGIRPIASPQAENGCCYCLIENNGERSFLSHHGAEYLFSRCWMNDVDFSLADSVFICGIELEDSCGAEISAFVCEHPELTLYFAPGPRITHIPAEIIDQLFQRRDINGKGPFLHLNEKEASGFTGKSNIAEAAEFLAARTENSVVITLGEQGCYSLQKARLEGSFIAGFPVSVEDTVGTGDAHFGALIACLKEGKTLEEACRIANQIGAAVAGIRGAVLDELPELSKASG